MSQSKQLTQFYKEYHRWIMHKAPVNFSSLPWYKRIYFSIKPIKLFERSLGLCGNLGLMYGCTDVKEKVYSEMIDQFIKESKDPIYPFNSLNETHYGVEALTLTCYSNPKRVQWVKDHL